MVHSCCVIGCTARWGPNKKFFRIPTEKDPEKRRKWLRAFRRLNPDAPKKAWIPSATDRVCEAHFVQGFPSHDPQHPDFVPSLEMGYPGSQKLVTKEKAVQRFERSAKRRVSETISAAVALGDDEKMDIDATANVDPNPPALAVDNERAPQTSVSCDHADRLQQLEAETKRLAEELLAQQQAAVFYNEKCTKLQEDLSRAEFTANNLTEKQLKYFTGVRNRELFDWIVKVVSACKLPSFCKKLSITDKVLLLLMKLRLGLQNKDLAYRFKINEDQVAKIVNVGSSMP
ncbi:uncharacterized protein LOC121636074 [Melanotaenia boesemani]|uniref:uncharacterized protein LOC121636074 n=1 Tax=Melanotaenia boesemani TaxID=1250792 RepID=UPI001C045BF5|nr:uncharacterized protein LOC121636074 [Melanotaenia boesemani]